MKLQRRTLSIQMQGEDVELLHRELRRLGLTITAEETDRRFFGLATHQAVVELQKKYGLSSTGVVDQQTATLINTALEASQPPPVRHVVKGQVRQEDGNPASGLIITGFDKQLRHEESLGEAVTDASGRYEIGYIADANRRPKGANVIVRVIDKTGTLLGTSDVIFNAGPAVEVNLSIALATPPPPSEYDKVRSILAPSLQGTRLADLSDEDITFAAKETGIERERIDLLKRSDALARETKTPMGVFYGWARQGLSLEKEALFTRNAEDLRTALEAAIERNIVPANLRQALPSTLQHVQQAAIKQRFLVRRRVVLQLRETTTGKPLGGYTVRVFSVDDGDPTRALNADVTNGRGYLAFVFFHPSNASTKAEYRFQLEILHAATGQRIRAHVPVRLEKRDIIQVRVEVPETPEPPSRRIDELASAVHLELPAATLQFLEGRTPAIRTLADIRRAGGIRHLKGLPDADHPALQILEAHANVEVLSPHLEGNAELIGKGFTSAREIAKASRADFVGAAHERMGFYGAGEMHAAAGVQAALADNVLTGIGAGLANGLRPGIPGMEGFEELFPRPCRCEECQAAVSPLAYLADLLNYALDHLKNGEQAISLGFLTERFRQPFGDLPATCDAMKQQVRQVRICTEVLRSYLGANGLPHGATRRHRLEEVERVYRINSYQGLLAQAGTTFEELRRSRATPEGRRTVADRLGIPAAHLDGLLLDPSDDDELTEPALEQIFGLADTSRNPLSTGAKLSDPHRRLTRWSVRGVEWNRNTDVDGRVHVRLRRAGDDDYRAEVYRDRERTQLVAYGEARQAVSSVEIAERDGSGLTGRFDIDLREGGETCEIALVPDLLSWRLQHLRDVWRVQDYGQDGYSRTAVEPLEEADLLPIVDPDVIGPDDFRRPEPGQPAFDFWIERRAQVDRWLSELRNERANGLDAALRVVFGAQLPDLDSISERLRGTPQAAGDARAEVEALSFTIGSFTRLMATRAKDRLRRASPANPEVTADEWSGLDSILAQVRKRREFAAWRQQERDAALLLGLRDFWISLREPTEGEWPIRPLLGQPLIDPSIVRRENLPEPGVGAAAIGIWKARQARLEAIPGELRAINEQQGLTSMLTEAFGVVRTLDDLDALASDLADPTRAEDARTTLATVFHLTEDDFQRLRQILEKTGNQDPARRPSAEEWEKAYALLTPPRKISHDFPVWVAEEEQAELRTNYWRSLKARLPRWRATPEARQVWQEALRRRGRAPIIDPDLIDRGHLIDPLSGPSARLWDERHAWVDRRLTALGDAATNLAGLDAAIRESLGASAGELPAMADPAAEEASSLVARLEQLGLPLDALQYLLRVRKLAEAGERVLDSEWTAAHSILVQVEKRREFAHWRQDEQDDGVVLGPDHFMIPEVAIEFPPAVPLPLPVWRATRRDLLAWEETLQSRKDQEKALKDAWWEAVGSVEATELPMLRDELVVATGDAEADFDTKAKWVVDNLLIDAKAGGCQKTSRISQAIETIQGLLWSVRTGQARDTLQGIVLDADEFDKEWEWIGSYPPWQSAMLVTLYPENILLPTLRRWQTPGFLDLVETVRANSRLTPEEACKAAQKYSEYYRDICSLFLEASCHARTRIQQRNCGSRVEGEPRCLFYLFARGSFTNTVYWSAHDRGGPAGHEQGFWAPVEPLAGIRVLNVIGAVPYQIAPEQRFIFLFVRTSEAGKQKLAFVKYDLEKRAWSGDLGDLELPSRDGTEASSFSAIVKEVYSEDEPPHLAIQLDAGGIYDRRLSREGDGWAPIPEARVEDQQQEAVAEPNGEASGTAAEPTDAWVPTVLESRGRDFVLRAMVAVNTEDRLLIGEWSGRRIPESTGRLWYRVLGPKDDGTWRSCATHSSEYLGAFLWPGGEDVYAFYRGDFGSEYRVIRRAAASADFTNEIGSIDHFNTWLQDITGLSLADWTVSEPDNPEDYGRNLLSFLRGYEAVWPNTDWAPIQKQITVVAEGLEKGERQEWNRANYWVRKLNSDLASIPDVLTRCFRGPVVLFKNREDDWAYPEGTSTGVRREVGCVAPVSGDTDKFQFAAREEDLNGTKMVRRYEFRRTAQENELEVSKYWAAPIVTGPFDITESLSRDALQLRRAAIEAQFVENEGHPGSDFAYLEEAYYFVPVHLAFELQPQGHYIAALDWLRTVYDYSAALADRKIFPQLREEEALPWDFRRSGQWLLDPLNPHSIAATRAETYTRFTLLALVRCLLDFADSEFTRDTAESVPRARTLYLTALDLLSSPELTPSVGGCDEVMGSFRIEIDVEDPQWRPIWHRLRQGLDGIRDRDELVRIIGELEQAAAGPGGWAERFGRMFDVLQQNRGRQGGWRGYGQVVGRHDDRWTRAERRLLAVPAFERAVKAAVDSERTSFLRRTSLVSGISAANLLSGRKDVPWLGKRREYEHPGDAAGQSNLPDPVPGEYFHELRLYDPLGPTALATLARFAAEHPLGALGIAEGREPFPVRPAALMFDFCVPPNPVLRALRLHAELNLHKIRTCRNIAGMERDLEPFAASTDVESGLPMIGAGGQLVLPSVRTIRPTQYRYSVLIERAKQLVQLAAQMEGGLLAAVEKRDQEAYQALKARQDQQLTRAAVQLQDLKVREATRGVTLALLQRERAETQIEHYQDWLSDPISSNEEASLALMQSSAVLSGLSAITSAGGAANLLAAVFSLGASATENTAAALGALASAAGTQAGLLASRANYERRAEEWRLALDLAREDARIADQSVRLANDRVRIVGQERYIAAMQADHAQEISEFLATKFTNLELYDWMSDVYQRVYSFFLQQATAVAQVAGQQLAFERQETPPPNILADYWEASGEAALASGDRESINRRGLTGSARLLQDIYQLDQYAFNTAKRKLQLTKTISLAQMAPAEFQRFRETGSVRFDTPLEIFDRDFPGHYLRLIHKVRTSVIALIPPTHGIHATLTASGLSRVVAGGDVFQTVVLRREPESVALTSPRDATGLFELQPPSEMLLPFEGIGVDTRWTFQIPKAANQFDYRTIADVLITIEYTALQSFDYQQQVIQTLRPTFSADRAFSFRHQFADQWYDLHNPDQTAAPMTVSFKTVRQDFPSNLENLKIEQVILYFAYASEGAFAVPAARLRFTEQGTAGAVGGEATPLNGIVSTRRGNAAGWMPMIGKDPMGTWELALPDNQGVRSLFKNKEIEDILFVTTYSGRSPEWPA